MRALARELLDLIFNAGCLRCRRAIPRGEGRDLCAECGSEVPIRTVNLCSGCGQAPVAGPVGFCRSCAGRFHRDGLVVPAPFEGAYRDLVHAFKYRADFRAGRYLACRMAGKVRETLPWEGAIIPVPLHRRRLRERGFNQACFLARVLAGESGLRLQAGALERRVHTRPLTGLTRGERAREMRGAIRVRRRAAVAGKDILLVDDVFTTGATAEECCRVLKKAGAARAVVVSAARA